MGKVENIAGLERMVRPFFTRFASPQFVVSTYSRERTKFIRKFVEEIPWPVGFPHRDLERTLWGIRFRSPIMNAAGMFKYGEGYELIARQSAGAYMGGTYTATERAGNLVTVGKHTIQWPFVPLPYSHAALNSLGLPNPGFEPIAKQFVLNGKENGENRRVLADGCPYGVSVAADSQITDEYRRLDALVSSICRFANIGVDFIEQNDSCPNSGDAPRDMETFERHLAYMKQQLDKKCSVRVPLVLKLSNDTKLEEVPQLVSLAMDYGYNGINFGNTSTQYDALDIDPRDRKLYDFFTKHFRGGVSGAPLRDRSLELAQLAVITRDSIRPLLRGLAPRQEFHVFRTGGIFTADDIKKSERARISMNMWFTGYFENFSKHGHGLYKKLYEDLTQRVA